MTRVAGSNSCNTCTRFGVISTFVCVTPVTLPPGRFRLLTRPILTGSAPTSKTIGMAVVAALAASAAGVLVAAITVHWQYGFNTVKLRAVTAAGPQFGPPGYELDLLYLAALAALVLGGSGPWRIDELIARQRMTHASQKSPSAASP